MSELVRNYLEGQVSRRVFVRRLVTSGVSLAGALAYADLLAAAPAAAATGSVQVTDYFFSMATTSVKLGDDVHWIWNFGSGHGILSETDGINLGFFQSPTSTRADYQFLDYTSVSPFSAAGTFLYMCDDPLHNASPMFGKIEVPPQVKPRRGQVGDRFTITWSTMAFASGGMKGFDVQVRPPGGQWMKWKDFVSTNQVKDKYQAKTKGKYDVRARLRNSATSSSSAWSPIVNFTAR